MGMVINRFEVYLITLDPTVGSEIKKTRPCLVLSPNELNRHIRTGNETGTRLNGTVITVKPGPVSGFVPLSVDNSTSHTVLGAASWLAVQPALVGCRRGHRPS